MRRVALGLLMSAACVSSASAQIPTTSESFSNFLSGLSQATTPSGADSFYLLQGGGSKRLPATTFFGGAYTWGGLQTFNGGISIPSSITVTTLNANAVNASTLAGTLTGSLTGPVNGVNVTGTPSVGQIPIATSSSTAAWGGAPTALSQCKNIQSFGGAGDNSTDNVAAYNAAIASFTPTGKCIYFPYGKYRFASTPNAWSTTSDSDSITIVGDGSEVTELTFPSVGTGFLINLQSPFNSVHLRNFSLTTGTTGAGGYGIQVVQNAAVPNPANTALSDVSGVTTRGAAGYTGANYWSTGVIINGVSDVNWINDYFTGPATGGFITLGKGVVVQGTATTFPVAHNFIGSYFNYLGTGVEIGNYVQGMAFTNVNITGGNIGIHVPGGLTGLTEISIVGSQFNVANVGFLVESAVPAITIGGSVFYSVTGSAVGVALESASISGCSIIGNVFTLIGTGALNGLAINAGGSWNCIIANNNFFNVTGVFGTGLFLQSGSARLLVTGNTFASLNANIINSGTNNVIAGNFPEFLYTIATLPTCDAFTVGQPLKISNGVTSPTYNAVVSTTGTTAGISVQCNGTAWTYH